MVAATIRTIFAKPQRRALHILLDLIVGMLDRQLPKVEAMLPDTADDLLAFTAFPVAHWSRCGGSSPARAKS
jgi:putative transposase